MKRFIVTAAVAVGLAACSPGTSVSDPTQPHATTPETTQPPETPTVGTDADHRDALPTLDEVRHWLYVLDVDLEQEMVGLIASSEHQLVVLDFISSEASNIDYPMAAVVEQLHDAAVPKLVLAYIDIGEAEEYRTYWQPDWRPGDPGWIAGLDPDGWEGNYPVAYWHDEWRAIWLGENGYLDQIVEAGFDGVYLDWVEAYSDENVLQIAERDGVDARQEMIWWVADIAEHGRSLAPGFVVVAQNAAELVEVDDYASVIDGLAQEQVWFDGGADNDPPGDCPLPRTDDDVDTAAYRDSLSEECRRQYDEFPDSTLHVSSDEYLRQLAQVRERDIPVFTVDYALDPAHASWVYETSRSLGYVPLVTSRGLDRFVPVVP